MIEPPQRVKHFVRDSGFGRFAVDSITLVQFFFYFISSQKFRYLLPYFFITPPQWNIGLKYGAHSRQTIDLYRNPAMLSKSAPIIAFVHGGAWGSGTPYMYRLVGLRLAQEGFHCVMIGYRTYPTTDIRGQLDDVEKALTFVHENLGENEFSDIASDSPVYLVGHSSGAHVASHVLLERHDKLKFVQGLVGLSGVYHIGEHLEFEKEKNVHDYSPLTPVNRGEENFDVHSPSLLVDKVPHGAQVPKFLLVHGREDEVVPHTSSKRLFEAMDGRRFNSELLLLEDVGHADIVTELFDMEKPIPYLEAIKEFCGLQSMQHGKEVHKHDCKEPRMRSCRREERRFEALPRIVPGLINMRFPGVVGREVSRVMKERIPALTKNTATGSTPLTMAKLRNRNMK
eukprot:jgi/Bigna1/134890/aug1.27_g9598